MKIIHTSDWHLGKQLHKVDLSSDLELFFDWLVQTIKTENVELLLVSGDIFDHAYPSQTALKQYYGFLKRMFFLDCKLIITGGNHDSSSVLNAPKELLNHLDIHVIGGAPRELKDLFIEFPEEKLVVAAVPFLKERDIRRSFEGEQYKDRIEQIKAGIANYFSNVNAFYRENYSDWDLITMGHLYAQGGTVSESMRDVQIGNQAGIDEQIFGSEPSYVALGHIHKPYRVAENAAVYYCGSPIALSFSEKEDLKQINLIDTSNGIWEPKILPTPLGRRLVQLTGTFDEIKEQVSELKESSTLQNLIHIRVVEQKESDLLRVQLEEFVNEINLGQEDFFIVKTELKFLEKKVFEVDMDLEVHELKASDVFEQKLNKEPIDKEEKEVFKQAFLSLIEEMNL